MLLPLAQHPLHVVHDVAGRVVAEPVASRLPVGQLPVEDPGRVEEQDARHVVAIGVEVPPEDLGAVEELGELRAHHVDHDELVAEGGRRLVLLHRPGEAALQEPAGRAALFVHKHDDGLLCGLRFLHGVLPLCFVQAGPPDVVSPASGVSPGRHRVHEASNDGRDKPGHDVFFVVFFFFLG